MKKQVPAEYFLLTFTLPAEFRALTRACGLAAAAAMAMGKPQERRAHFVCGRAA